MGGGTGGASPFVPMPTEGIKLLQGLYREPGIDNLRKMMNIFVYDPSDLTEALFKTRLDNILANREHLENFIKSLSANPKQFPDFSSRLGEIKARTLIVWGVTIALCQWIPDCDCWRVLPDRSCTCSATADTGCSGNMPTPSIVWCWISSAINQGVNDE